MLPRNLNILLFWRTLTGQLIKKKSRRSERDSSLDTYLTGWKMGLVASTRMVIVIRAPQPGLVAVRSSEHALLHTGMTKIMQII